jgi:hypothetical protein
MKQFVCLFLGCMTAVSARCDSPPSSTLAGDGTLVVTNTLAQGIVTVKKALDVNGPWVPSSQTFSVGPATQLKLAFSDPAAFFRPEVADLAGPGSWTFIADDILDLASLYTRLVAPADTDGVSIFLWDQLSFGTQDLLLSYAGGGDPVLQQALADDLSIVIQGISIYDDQRFASVTLSQATQDLMAQNPTGSALVRLNRLLIEDAYPQELRKKVDLGFTRLVNAYGVLTTLAGAGGTTVSPTDKWLPDFEGGPATNALLSRPHIAMADGAGNVYIADKEAHGIRMVTPDGNIHTVAGINVPGPGTTDPSPATTVALSNPNGIWVRADGTFYILDRDNGYIRKVDTNGIMTLMVDNGGAIPEGRGLWVSPDESILFYSAGNQLKRWDSTNGLAVLADGFIQLGNLAVDPQGRLAVTDRGANHVYGVGSDGSRTVLAGNGTSFGGGDGYLATETGLAQVRGIWFLPTGAYFLATDSGSQVWYVDTDGYIHLFLDGDSFSHAGDGAWFYDPAAPKVSKVRQITMDYDGNMIITEHDAGYIRKVQFLPYAR